jgi:hypothetical protein
VLVFESLCEDLAFVTKKPYRRLGALCLESLCEASLVKIEGGLVGVDARLLWSLWYGLIAWWDTLLGLCIVGYGLLLMVDALTGVRILHWRVLALDKLEGLRLYQLEVHCWYVLVTSFLCTYNVYFFCPNLVYLQI